jgi:hypothetical protein
MMTLVLLEAILIINNTGAMNMDVTGYLLRTYKLLQIGMISVLI